MTVPDFFESEVIKVSKIITIHFLNIKEISPEFSKYLDSQIVQICSGQKSTDEIDKIKRRLHNFLESKKNSNIPTGAIAEFFVHVYLNHLGYKQESMLFNLEENSIKKGFDGYYTHGKIHWIMESKSSLSSTINASHETNIATAFSDLAKKLSGGVKNNPWRNAYNHAGHKDVNTRKTIQQIIKEFSDKFDDKILPAIETHNLIPSSNMFYLSGWSKIDSADLKTKIEEKIQKQKYKSLNVVCINNTTIESFKKYISPTT